MSAIPSGVLPVMPTEPVFPLTVEQYHAMIESGVLTDDDPVELLEGVLVFQMPKNPPHRYVLRAVSKAVVALLPDGWIYLQQEPITLDDGEPEPDGAVVRGTDEDFKTRHPGPKETGLVIEVSDSTLNRDRGIKLRSYARAGVVRYWIVNLIDRCVEVYTRPTIETSEPTYLDKQIVTETESLALVIDGKELGHIAVRELLP